MMRTRPLGWGVALTVALAAAASAQADTRSPLDVARVLAAR